MSLSLVVNTGAHAAGTLNACQPCATPDPKGRMQTCCYRGPIPKRWRSTWSRGHAAANCSVVSTAALLTEIDQGQPPTHMWSLHALHSLVSEQEAGQPKSCVHCAGVNQKTRFCECCHTFCTTTCMSMLLDHPDRLLTDMMATSGDYC